jgi:glycosyltransferase involved in cell wall biosynthesis
VVEAGYMPSGTPGVDFINVRPYGLVASSGKNKLDKAINTWREKGFLYLASFMLFWFVHRHFFPKPISGIAVKSLRKKRLKRLFGDHHFDLVIGNDLTSLPVITQFAASVVVYDAHEYSPGQFPDVKKNYLKIRHADRTLRTYLPWVNRMMTTCEGAADIYSERYGVTRPVVITNAPQYRELMPVERGDGKILLVHHGLAGRVRSLEVMVDAVIKLDDRFQLDFYLVSRDDAYMDELKRRAEAANGRIRFMDPVPMEALPETINRYDVGIVFFPPTTWNLAHALPNKFFECVQGRIAVAISPSVEMIPFVERYGLGVISRDFTADGLAAALSGLTIDNVREFKSNAHSAARELSAEPQMKRLESFIEECLKERDRLDDGATT